MRLVAGVTLCLWACGCAGLRYANSAPTIKRHIRTTDDSLFVSQFKAAVLYPARDILTLDPLCRTLFGDEAWNATDADLAGSSFITRRDVTDTAWGKPPVQPFRIDRVKSTGATPGFFGTDADGRKYLVKLDHPDYPELGSSVSVIASRVYHALGYNVPPTFVVDLYGTGDDRFDGRRAAASLLIPDVIGHFQFDWFRYRREIRGLRMVAAWLNDTDRTASNTLVGVRDDVARYYLIDFNSTLGAWQGQPKEPWRGWRYAVGSPARFLEVLTLGLIRPGYDPHQPLVSPAVGRLDANFDPLTWKPQVANTAFDHMTNSDRDWIVRRIARLQPEHLEAIIDAAGLSNPKDRLYMLDTLLARQACILKLVDDSPGGLQP
ncbi:MAG: hypothetical protein KAV82_14005 [Phycisphaerae bacterium]|nr:hypothetical protein [Phycisphaerae bacterium]